MSLTRRIAERSRDIFWDHGIDPKDAVHVASALAAKVGIFSTFDKKLIGKSGSIDGSTMIIEKSSVDQGDLLS